MENQFAPATLAQVRMLGVEQQALSDRCCILLVREMSLESLLTSDAQSDTDHTQVSAATGTSKLRVAYYVLGRVMVGLKSLKK